MNPDLILMDINLPKLNGIEATRQILAQNPRIGILIITMFEDERLTNFFAQTPRSQQTCPSRS